MGVPDFSPLERVREAALDILSTHTASELALITLEAESDLVIPEPTEYARTPSAEITNLVTVEVITLRARFGAAGAPVEFSFGRITTDVAWEARAVVVNDGRWDDAEFMKVLDRYAALFLRLFAARYPRLGYEDGTVLHTVPSGDLFYSVDTQRDPSGKRVRCVHVPFATKVQETVTWPS